MRQEIYKDPYPSSHWDLAHCSRAYIHILNSETFKQVTGQNPPALPPSASDYARHGLPWFDFYSDQEALDGSSKLANLDSVAATGIKKGEKPLPENEPINPTSTIKIGSKKGQARDGSW